MVNLILSYPPLNHVPFPIHSFILKNRYHLFFPLGSLIIVFVINLIGLSLHTYTVEYQHVIHLWSVYVKLWNLMSKVEYKNPFSNIDILLGVHFKPMLLKLFIQVIVLWECQLPWYPIQWISGTEWSKLNTLSIPHIGSPHRSLWRLEWASVAMDEILSEKKKRLHTSN